MDLKGSLLIISNLGSEIKQAFIFVLVENHICDQNILSANEKTNQFWFLDIALGPLILWSFWSWSVHSKSRKIDAYKNKRPAIFVAFPCFSPTSEIRKFHLNYFWQIHHNNSFKKFLGLLFKLGFGILDVLKEFRLLEHTATHYLLTRDFIIGKKAHDCKLTMPPLL